MKAIKGLKTIFYTRKDNLSELEIREYKSKGYQMIYGMHPSETPALIVKTKKP